MRYLLYILLFISLGAHAQLPGLLPMNIGTGVSGTRWTLVGYSVDSPSTNNATTITSTAFNTTTADLYIVVVVDLSTAAAGTLTNNGTANTYTLDTSFNGTGGSYRLRVYRCSNPTTNAAQTWTYTSANVCIPVIYTYAWKGSAASPVDQRNQQITAGTITSIGTGGITPSVNNALVMTVLVSGSVGAPTISGGGFTNSDRKGFTTLIGSRQWGTAVYFIEQTTAASTNPTHSFSTSSFGALGHIRSYKPQ